MVGQTNDDGSSGDLLTDVGNEVKVTLDQWSVGHLGWIDLITAAAVIGLGMVLAWFANRLVRRAGRRAEGPARTAIGTIGQLASASVMLLSTALALEVLGFSLGPVLILMLIVVIAVLLMRPLLTNLSSGLILQVRGALEVGDLVMTNDELGTVREITTRTVVIDTADGRRVHSPNSDVLNHKIVNYTTLGRRRSSLEVMVAWNADVELVLATMRLALSQVAEIETDPPPRVEVCRVSGRLLVVRAFVWHGPRMPEQRAAVDAAIRSVLNDLGDAGIELDGPTFLELGSDAPPAIS